jgi:hypothetical protein
MRSCERNKRYQAAIRSVHEATAKRTNASCGGSRAEFHPAPWHVRPWRWNSAVASFVRLRRRVSRRVEGVLKKVTLSPVDYAAHRRRL